MNPIVRLFATLSLAAAAAGCAPAPDMALRQAPLDLTGPAATGPVTGPVTGPATGPAAPVTAPAARYDVKAVTVLVPPALVVSEANLYYPPGDIVWRGEPRGDRHAQVKAIFDEGFAEATAAMTRGAPVTVDVEVTRFHALSEKTRYSVGGVHAMRYRLTVRDAASGAVLDGPRLVVADYRAAGGRRALDEEAAGLTQRAVAVHNLALSAARALSAAPAPTLAPDPGPGVSRHQDDLRLGLTAVSMKNERERPAHPPR